MKRVLPHLTGVFLVMVGFVIGSVLTGDNVIAQKLAALTGSGSPGKLAKWTSENALGNSSVSEDKSGLVSIANGIKFPDGSILNSAGIGSATHHQELTLVGQPSERLSFALPKNDSPVRIEISTSVIVEQFPICNGTGFGTSTSGPLSVNIVVALDSSTGRITNTSSRFIEGDGHWSAILSGDQISGRMVISPSACAVVPPSCCNFTPIFVTSGPITYHVSMWY